MGFVWFFLFISIARLVGFCLGAARLSRWGSLGGFPRGYVCVQHHPSLMHQLRLVPAAGISPAPGRCCPGLPLPGNQGLVTPPRDWLGAGAQTAGRGHSQQSGPPLTRGISHALSQPAQYINWGELAGGWLLGHGLVGGE